MTAFTETPTTPLSQDAVDLARALRAAFQRMPERRRQRCTVPPTGDAGIDRPVLVEAVDGSDHYTGVIVAGERDQAGAWSVDDAFTLLSLDHGAGAEAVLVTCNGWNCHVERL